ncbi:MAG: RNA polymerase sporulation sigma factor SigK [Clostridia bacterium]|nr:RNA polymerase sporulation sigma factor SigK [Clostridia bacterium]
MLKISKKLKNLLNSFLHFELLDQKENFIFFVCGTEALPSPLGEKEEAIVIAGLKGGSEEAKAKLIEHNLRLVVYISKKFNNTGLDIEDLISVGAIGLIKAVNSYDPDKQIKLATYASRCIENEILMYLRKMSKVRNEVSISEPIKVDWEGNNISLMDILNNDDDCPTTTLEREVEKQVLLNCITTLNKREQQIVKLRFGLFNVPEKTQKEVADMLGISQSYISRLEKKIIEKLKKDINKVF